MRDEETARRVHRNLIEVCAQFANSPGGKVRREDDAVMFATATSLPFLNGVVRQGPGGDPRQVIEQAREFFSELDRGFVVYCWPGDPGWRRRPFTPG